MKYSEAAVSPSDSYVAVAKAIELKWHLFTLNNLFTKETDAGIRVGMRAVQAMLDCSSRDHRRLRRLRLSV